MIERIKEDIYGYGRHHSRNRRDVVQTIVRQSFKTWMSGSILDVTYLVSGDKIENTEAIKVLYENTVNAVNMQPDENENKSNF